MTPDNPAILCAGNATYTTAEGFKVVYDCEVENCPMRMIIQQLNAASRESTKVSELTAAQAAKEGTSNLVADCLTAQLQNNS